MFDGSAFSATAGGFSIVDGCSFSEGCGGFEFESSRSRFAACIRRSSASNSARDRFGADGGGGGGIGCVNRSIPSIAILRLFCSRRICFNTFASTIGLTGSQVVQA